MVKVKMKFTGRIVHKDGRLMAEFIEREGFSPFSQTTYFSALSLEECLRDPHFLLHKPNKEQLQMAQRAFRTQS